MDGHEYNIRLPADCKHTGAKIHPVSIGAQSFDAFQIRMGLHNLSHTRHQISGCFKEILRYFLSGPQIYIQQHRLMASLAQRLIYHGPG